MPESRSVLAMYYFVIIYKGLLCYKEPISVERYLCYREREAKPIM